jgi:hypothetical protein
VRAGDLVTVKNQKLYLDDRVFPRMVGIVLGTGITMTNGVTKVRVVWGTTDQVRDEHPDFLEVIS